MRKHSGWSYIIGFFGLIAAAEAQTAAPPAAVTQFNGTYEFVSQASVNATYRTFENRERPCGPRTRTPGPLTIVNGSARYTGAAGSEFEGTVGPQGELTMRSIEPAPKVGWGSPGILRIFNGRIDGTGMIYARVITGGCSWDLSWRKKAN